MEKFDSTCRTCNTERSNLVNLSSKAPGDDTLKLYDVLSTVCPSIPIQESDRLPHKICYFCSKQLEIAYKFQLQCKKSHEELWKMIETSIKEEPMTISSSVEDENHQNSEDEDRLWTENGFDDCTASLTENLEFLDEDDTTDHEDEVEEVSEVVEDNPQHVVDVELVSSATNEAPIMCCHCDKKFFTENGLRFHEKLAHKNLKPILIKAEILTIECKYCHQVFEKNTELTLHCRLHHRNEFARELTCNFCQKTFPAKNRFEHHLQYHGKNRYLCTVKDCRRAFVIKYKLSDHLKRYHGIVLTSSEMRALKPCIVEES